MNFKVDRYNNQKESCTIHFSLLDALVVEGRHVLSSSSIQPASITKKKIKMSVQSKIVKEL